MRHENLIKEKIQQTLYKQYGTNPPPPKQIEGDYLTLLSEMIEKENQTRPKGQRIKMLQTMPPEAIAFFILNYHSVIRIPYSGDEPEMYNDLYIYVDKGDFKGLYSRDENLFAMLIRQYDFSATDNKIANVISHLKPYAPIRQKCENKDLVPVNNGLFDYKKKVLLPFNPDLVFTAKSPIDFIPNAPNVLLHNEDGTDWDVESWMSDLSDDEDVVRLLWQLAGATVRYNVNFDTCVGLYGPDGAGGKSTLITLLRALSGRRNSPSIPFRSFSKDFHLENLLYSTNIFTDEVSTSSDGGYLKNAETFKALISGDSIFMNRKFKTPISADLNPFIIFGLNEMINFADKSGSLERRLLFVPMLKSFRYKKRKYIKEKYVVDKKVLEHVLYKVLAELPDYDDFSTCAACEALKDEFLRDTNPILDFLKDVIPQFNNPMIPLEMLFDLYLNWLKRHRPNANPVNNRAFYRDVRRFVSSKTFPDWDAPTNSVPTRNNLSKPEPLLQEYGVSNWLNIFYAPHIKAPASSYRAIRRVTWSNP